MYTIRVDGKVLYSEYTLMPVLNANLQLEANKAGKLIFSILPSHYLYDDIQYLKSTVSVYQDDDLIFFGFPVSSSVDIDKIKTINCEGILSALNRSVQLPKKYSGSDFSVDNALAIAISQHNSEMNIQAWNFAPGNVSGFFDTDIKEWSTNNATTMDTIIDLANRIGGTIVARREGTDTAGINFIDIVNGAINPSSVNPQTIEFGKNIINYVSRYDLGEISSRIVPLGAKKDTVGTSGEKERLGINSVEPHGRIFLYSDDLNTLYGSAWKTVVFDKLSDPSALLIAGQQYMNNQSTAISIELTAYDLGQSNADIQKFKMLEVVHAVSSEYELDIYSVITKMAINIIDPTKNKISLGKILTKSISEQTAMSKKDFDNY